MSPDTIVGPVIEVKEFTMNACRVALVEYLQANKRALSANTVYAVVVPEGALPEAMPYIVFPAEFGSAALALRLSSQLPNGMRLVGVAGRFVFMEPKDRVKPKEAPVLHIRADEESKYRDMPNFIPAEKLSRRMSGPHEVGALASSVTTKYGIGFSRGHSYGEIICFVELAKEKEPA